MRTYHIYIKNIELSGVYNLLSDGYTIHIEGLEVEMEA